MIKRTYQLSWVMAALVITAGGMFTMCSGQSTPAVAFQLERPTITLHEPVQIKVVLHNPFGEKAVFDLGSNRMANFAFTVIAPDGAKTNPPNRSIQEFGRTAAVAVPAGGSYEQVLLLDEWYRPEVPGDYRIEARLTTPAKAESGKTAGPFPAESLTLKVLPRDPNALQATCERLAQSAIGDPYVKASEAAAALSWVDDPIAVPSLRQVLDAKGLTWAQAVRGLARAGDKQAVEALLAHANDPSQDVQAVVRGALSDLYRKSQDPGLKREIGTALGLQR